jgi:hypothetical protein
MKTIKVLAIVLTFSSVLVLAGASFSPGRPLANLNKSEIPDARSCREAILIHEGMAALAGTTVAPEVSEMTQRLRQIRAYVFKRGFALQPAPGHTRKQLELRIAEMPAAYQDQLHILSVLVGRTEVELELCNQPDQPLRYCVSMALSSGALLGATPYEALNHPGIYRGATLGYGDGRSLADDSGNTYNLLASQKTLLNDCRDVNPKFTHLFRAFRDFSGNERRFIDSIQTQSMSGPHQALAISPFNR